MRLLERFVSRLGPQQRARLVRLRHPAFAGTLRRIRPLSPRYGFDRGTPVDRYYIESFLAGHAQDICGRCLEVKSSAYIRRFGVGVERIDVLDVDPKSPDATVVADLARADSIASNQFDCFVLTQTLHLILEFQAALRHAHRILKPGGVLLATVPAVSRVDRTLSHIDYWRLTPAACTTLFGAVFGPDNIALSAYGNVFTATAFLMGMAAEELTAKELGTHDPSFPILTGIRSVKR